MKHPIDPKVDCVFKAILGAERNKNLLIDFLNAMLHADTQSSITKVELLNPYNEREFYTDKLSIVDVKAIDEQGQIYQIEIQLAVYPSLPARILYTWSDLYSQQLQSGEEYAALKTTYAVWLIDGILFEQDDRYYHQFSMQDEHGLHLTGHGGIVVIELPKFHAAQISNSQQRWIQFFNAGETITDPEHLPEWMQTPEMEQAMTTLKQFSEKELAYHQYQARQNYLREQATIQKDLAELRRTAEVAKLAVDIERTSKEEAQKMAATEREAKEAEREAKEAALVKIKALEQQLMNKG